MGEGIAAYPEIAVFQQVLPPPFPPSLVQVQQVVILGVTHDDDVGTIRALPRGAGGQPHALGLVAA